MDSKNFVLRPGKAYDRSPCGTGTSAKLACLAADRKLLEGDVWVQESLIGSTFEAGFRWHDRRKGEIVPIITGTAAKRASREHAALLKTWRLGKLQEARALMHSHIKSTRADLHGPRR